MGYILGWNRPTSSQSKSDWDNITMPLPARHFTSAGADIFPCILTALSTFEEPFGFGMY
jgi:hypothetical protein